MANITKYQGNFVAQEMQRKAQMSTVPDNLPFDQQEWSDMPEEERLEALQFFHQETLNSVRGLKLEFPKIQYPTSGGAWVRETADGEPVMHKELKGIVVFHLPSRVYYESSETTGQPPICVSDDGVLPNEQRSQVVQSTTCGSCQHAQWGTGKEGRGQACKARHRIFVLLNNEEIPCMISLPPTGVRPFVDYVTRLLQAKTPLVAVETALGLIDETSAGGQKFKKLLPRVSRKLTYAETRRAAQIREQFAAQMEALGVSYTEEMPAEDEPDF